MQRWSADGQQILWKRKARYWRKSAHSEKPSLKSLTEKNSPLGISIIQSHNGALEMTVGRQKFLVISLVPRPCASDGEAEGRMELCGSSFLQWPTALKQNICEENVHVTQLGHGLEHSLPAVPPGMRACCHCMFMLIPRETCVTTSIFLTVIYIHPCASFIPSCMSSTYLSYFLIVCYSILWRSSGLLTYSTLWCSWFMTLTKMFSLNLFFSVNRGELELQYS